MSAFKQSKLRLKTLALLGCLSFLPNCLGNGNGYPGKEYSSAPALGNAVEAYCTFALATDTGTTRSGAVTLSASATALTATVYKADISVSGSLQFVGVSREDSQVDRHYSGTNFDLVIQLSGIELSELKGTLGLTLPDESTLNYADLLCTIR